MPFCTTAELEELWTAAGLRDVRTGAPVVERTYADFDDFWEPFTFGVGPGGAYCNSLEPDRREALRMECSRQLGEPRGEFTLTGRAWFVGGTRPPAKVGLQPEGRSEPGPYMGRRV